MHLVVPKTACGTVQGAQVTLVAMTEQLYLTNSGQKLASVVSPTVSLTMQETPSTLDPQQ